jgi:hypothetical protein
MVGITSGFLKRAADIYAMVALIAAAHIFRVGSYLEGAWYNAYYSYFSDFMLPFGFYFLLSAVDLRAPQDGVPAPVYKAFSLLGRWQTKLAMAFLLPAIAETCQYFGIPVLGSTFDPLDYLVYGLGALAAVVLDTRVFSRAFDFWTTEAGGG